MVDGYRPAEGRVELFFNGCWGTVCDDSWSLNDATVVCRQLDYPRALQALQRASYGQGVGRIVLDDLLCTGSESNLLDCPSFTPAGTHNCGHSEDASVVCENDISELLATYIALIKLLASQFQRCVHTYVCSSVSCYQYLSSIS